MDLKDIKAIIDLMKKNSISEFELEKEDFKIKMRRGFNGGQFHGEDSQVFLAPPAQIMPPNQAGGQPGAETESNEVEITSPMIGTFYRAPSPEAQPYVEVGTEVEPETVVCIIEAMKVMNEIKAETRGVISSIVVDNSKPVEFGQPLFKVKPL